MSARRCLERGWGRDVERGSGAYGRKDKCLTLTSTQSIANQRNDQEIVREAHRR